MPCLAETDMRMFCNLGKEINPAYCHAKQQAADELAVFDTDSSLAAIELPDVLETDIRTSFQGCDQLEKVITGIRQELARRRA